MAADVIVIFAKPPLPGRTKSRLAAALGDQFAADLSAAMLADLVHIARRVPDADLILCHTPDSTSTDFGGIEELFDSTSPQRGSDLGERMHQCFRDVLNDKGYSRAVIIGSDCITHSSESLVAALALLAQTSIVIQPAEDGGYVLIGMGQAIDAAFVDMVWGTSSVMNQTRCKLRRAGLGWKELPPSFDVDTVDDLDRLSQFISLHPRPSVEAVLARKRINSNSRIQSE